MPTPIRKLLDTLTNDRLRRLIELRGLETSRSMDEKAETLARSYRGDYQLLVSDAALEDLKAFAVQGARDVGLDFELVNVQRASRAQLEKIIVKVFGEDWRPKRDGDFVPWTGNVVHAVFVANEGDSDEEEEELDEADDDEAEDGEPEAPATPFEDLGDDWSRPQLLRRVVQKVLGLRLQRLRTTRFRELLSALRALGIEVGTLVGEVLGEASTSPGLEVKIRLRKARLPERPIIIAGPPTPPPARIPLPPYEAALRRLKLLTAVPDDGRLTNPAALVDFVHAATAGLRLNPAELRLLEKVAHGLAKGTHPPLAAAHDLANHTEAETWTWLLEEMVRLNPGHELIAKHTAQEIRESVRGVPAAPEAVIAMGSAPPAPPPAIERVPPPRPVSQAPAPMAAGATNVRALGDLDDMFK